MKERLEEKEVKEEEGNRKKMEGKKTTGDEPVRECKEDEEDGRGEVFERNEGKRRGNEGRK